jgi:hypothetical protein
MINERAMHDHKASKQTSESHGCNISVNRVPEARYSALLRHAQLQVLQHRRDTRDVDIVVESSVESTENVRVEPRSPTRVHNNSTIRVDGREGATKCFPIRFFKIAKANR